MEKCFTYAAAFKRKVIPCGEKIGRRAAGRKYTVCEACVRNWGSIKTKLFSCLFLDQGKGEILRLMPLF
jgi:hypothetical protein